MVTPDFIVGIIGNIIAVLVYAAPIGTFGEIVKLKSSQKYDVLPYVTTLLCKSLWTFYGALNPADGILLITVNGIGVVAESIYIIIFFIYASKKIKNGLILMAISNLAIVGLVIILTIVLFQEESKRRIFMGVLCATVTIIMYAAPFRIMFYVIKTRSVEYMSFFLSFVLLLNAACWCAYAAIRKDYYVIVPNGIGILSSTSQIVLYLLYKNKSKTLLIDEEMGSIKSEVTNMQHLTP